VADPDRPLFADATEEMTQLGADLFRIADLRWKLARLELEAAASSVKRLVIVAVVAATMALTSLPILVVGAIHFLPDWAQAGSLLAAGLVLLLAAILVSWWARRRFLREYVGLEESLEELREDLVWLQEWTGRGTSEEK
jgi:uncharacterized membrane protein YqjE